MSGVEATPCCCKENHPCCVEVYRTAGQCTCLQRGECPDVVLCEVQPPPALVIERFALCAESAAECDALAEEYCDQTPGTVVCRGTYFPTLRCDQEEEAACASPPGKLCPLYECGWCGEHITTGCFVDYTTDPCPEPPTCVPDPCCDPDPPGDICCCRSIDGSITVVAPCPIPTPPNCVVVQDPADCGNCGELYTPLPCSSICCCTGANCFVVWDLGPNPPPQPSNGFHCAAGGCAGPGGGFGTCGLGCTISQANCNGSALTIPYCCCSCYPCQYCDTDIAALNQCLAAMEALGLDCLCPVKKMGICNCTPINGLAGPSEVAAPPPVQSLESGVVLGAANKPTINNIFLFGYGTFNL